MLLFPGVMVTATGAVVAGIGLVLDRMVKPRTAALA